MAGITPSMGNSQSQTDGIVQMLQHGCTSECICHTIHCSKRKVSQVVHTMHDENYHEGDAIRLTAIRQGAPDKVTPEISSDIETISLLDAMLTNQEIRTKIIERFGVTLSESTVSTERQK
jgi:hypothetical protein